MLGNAIALGFTPGGGEPAILGDGNTVVWLEALETYMTKNAAELVSQWDDRSGNDNHLLQATETNRPFWSLNGVLFDGNDNFMKPVAFTLEQPEFIYMVFKQETWTNLDYILDGNTALQGTLQNSGVSANFVAYAGSASAQNSNLPVNRFGIVRVLFNGAGSKLQVDETTPIESNFGTRDMGGLTLGANGTPSIYGNIEVKELIIRNIADNATDEALIYNYLKNKYPAQTLMSTIGDSITKSATQENWTDLARADYDINNRAGSGEDIISDMAGQVLKCATDDTDVLILFLGTNDDNAGDMGALQTELETQIAALKISNSSATIYQVNVLPRWTDTGGGTPVDKSNIRTAIAAACLSESITCWDSFTIPWITSVDTVDGLHPNAAGASKIWNEIKSRL